MVITLAVLLVLATIASFWAGHFLFNLALSPEGDKSLVFAQLEMNDYDADAYPDQDGSVEELLHWTDGLAVEDVTVTANDGTSLHSLWLRQETLSDRWCIDIHGYYDRAWFGLSAKAFYDRGYNLLLPDLRGHGESGGEYISMGWLDRLDILRYAEMIVEENPRAEIVIYGISMGAATALMASGETLPANVKCIVEDCGYTSVDDEFAYLLNMLFGLPRFPLLYTANYFSITEAKMNFYEASALEQVKKSDTPTLFIHGDADTFVPYEMVYELYDAAACAKELYIVEGALHGSSYLVAGQAYWERVFNFVDRYIT